MLISEAKLSSLVVLASIPIILAVVVLASSLSGSGLDDGMFYEALGPVVYLIFYGGAVYACYTFVKIAKERLNYITHRDGQIHILQQGSIRLDEIESVTVERGLAKNLVIRTSGGRTVRIRGYLLQRDLGEVRHSIEMLGKSESRRPSNPVCDVR